MVEFQSTHSRGVRHRTGRKHDCGWIISIHALTRSATRFVSNLTKTTKNFNPRTHEECDGYTNELEDADLEFQSTHSRGVRRLSASSLNWTGKISIHALTRSATGYAHVRHVQFGISIHALTRSATTLSLAIALSSAISIHALTRSATG